MLNQHPCSNSCRWWFRRFLQYSRWFCVPFLVFGFAFSFSFGGGTDADMRHDIVFFPPAVSCLLFSDRICHRICILLRPSLVVTLVLLRLLFHCPSLRRPCSFLVLWSRPPSHPCPSVSHPSQLPLIRESPDVSVQLCRVKIGKSFGTHQLKTGHLQVFPRHVLAWVVRSSGVLPQSSMSCLS